MPLTSLGTARALVIFLDPDKPEKRPDALDIRTVQQKKSAVDKWVGVIEGAELGDWKAERRAALEGKAP